MPFFNFSTDDFDFVSNMVRPGRADAALSVFLTARGDAAGARATASAAPTDSVVAAAAPAGSIEGTNGADTLVGTQGFDIIVGYQGDDDIDGLGGRDLLVGNAGNDVLDGNAGDDILLGGAGQDVLIGGRGNDLLVGGTGADIFILGDGTDRINDFEAGIDTIFVSNMARNLIDISQNGTSVVISFSGSTTTVPNATVSEVSDALQVQTTGFVQVNEDGWGDRQEVYAWAQEVFDGYLYVSTLNLDGAQAGPEIEGAGGLYRYSSSTGEWETISVDGLGNTENDGIRNLLEFDGMLYAGTLNADEGSELLRSTDGINFETVITGGFGRPDLGSVRALYEFEDALYVGFQSLVDGEPLLMLRSEDGENFVELDLPGSDDADFANNSSLHSFTEFDGYLYAGTRNTIEGFELYRSDDGVEWDAVVGGDSGLQNGIESDNNNLIYHMIEFDGALYIGSGNSTDGFGVFRSFDGTSFEQVGEYGFGDSGNKFAWRFHIHDDQLYLGTSFEGEGAGGGSVFRTDDGDVWEELVGINGAYDLPGFNDTTNWGVRSFETYDDELYIGTANFPYFQSGAENAIGAQVFQFLGDPEPGTPDYLY